MKNVLVFGGGKSATHLIGYLLDHAEKENWQVWLADADYEMAARKMNNHPRGKAIGLDIRDSEKRRSLINASSIVISMLPPFLHGKIAEDCADAGKNLLTASYIDEQLESLRHTVEKKGLLFLCEMGLDPGIDHMSAMEMMDSIRAEGGVITGFRSHCGGLVAPESDDNPWHYKISWNPRNIIMAGKAGAHYRENGKDVHLSHSELFTDSRRVNIPGLGTLCWYPNRDSLSYEKLYGLHNTPGFVRTTLRHPQFMTAWKHIVDLQLTEETPAYNTENLSLGEAVRHHLNHYQAPTEIITQEPFASQWKFLGFDDTAWQLDRPFSSPADLLQIACEKKLALQASDKDMIVMLHEIDYVLNNINKNKTASLVVKGDDSVHTAMSKTVGLPLGIACRLILNGTINQKGLQIPVAKEIYQPVLKELAENGIAFKHS